MGQEWGTRDILEYCSPIVLCAPTVLRGHGAKRCPTLGRVGAVQFYTTLVIVVPFPSTISAVTSMPTRFAIHFVFSLALSRNGASQSRGWTSPAQQRINVEVNLPAAKVSCPCVMEFNDGNSDGFPT